MLSLSSPDVEALLAEGVEASEELAGVTMIIIIIAAVAAVLVVVAIGVTCYCKKVKAGKADTADASGGDSLLAPPKGTTI